MTKQQLRDFTSQLRRQADVLDTALNESAAENEDSFEVALFPTLKKGIDSLAKFIGAVHTTLANHAMNSAIFVDNTIQKSQQDAERLASEDKPQDTKRTKKKPKP